MIDRKKPGLAFWMTIAVVVAPVAYPLSFGPACWIYRSETLPPLADQAIHHIYIPLADYAISETSPAAGTLWWWSRLGANDGAWKFAAHPRIKVQPYHAPPYR